MKRRKHAFQWGPLLLVCACSALPQEEMEWMDWEDPDSAPIATTSAPSDHEAPGYWRSRWSDFLQMASLRAGVGPGLGARVAATKAVQVGWMKLGPAEEFGEILRFPAIYAGNTATELGAWDVRSIEYGFSRWYHYSEDVIAVTGPEHDWSGGVPARSATSIELAAHLGLAGVSASFDPVAAVHFLLGWFGL